MRPLARPIWVITRRSRAVSRESLWLLPLTTWTLAVAGLVGPEDGLRGLVELVGADLQMVRRPVHHLLQQAREDVGRAWRARPGPGPPSPPRTPPGSRSAPSGRCRRSARSPSGADIIAPPSPDRARSGARSYRGSRLRHADAAGGLDLLQRLPARHASGRRRAPPRRSPRAWGPEGRSRCGRRGPVLGQLAAAVTLPVAGVRIGLQHRALRLYRARPRA